MPTEPRSTDRRPTGESRPRFTSERFISEQSAGDRRSSWPVRILIGDPRDVVRQAAKKVIGATDDLKFVGAAASCEDMLEEASRHQPNVVLVNGAFLKCIRPARSLVEDRLSGSRVIVLGTKDDAEGFVEAMEAGASGFLSRRCTFDDVIEVVRDVIRESAVPTTQLHPSSPRAKHLDEVQSRLGSAETA
jgi:DNA-binding NarL/FixJ family response regulator